MRFIAVLFLLTSLGVFNSSGQLARLMAGNELNGDKEFEVYAFADALDFYLRAYKNDSSDIKLVDKIGTCYQKLNQSKNAEMWFGKLLRRAESDSVELDPLAMYHYAEALKANQKYDQAAIWFQKYDMVADDHRASKKLDAIQNQSVLMDDAHFFEVNRVNFNVPEADFSPFFYKDGLAFVSGRKNRALGHEYKWDNSHFLDVFVVNPNDPESIPVGIKGKINSRFHDGPISFYDNDTKAAFTRNNFNKGKQKRSEEEINHLQIYFADTVDGEWGIITPFQYNSAEYSTGHPSVRADGRLMIFVSDKPGGHGRSDLYYCYPTEEGWSEPINMGPEINTKGNELFPFLDHNILYFASDGHGGLGGLDIFHLNISHPETLANAGSPLNSHQDDFGLVSRGKEGYFTSNRSGDDDIYHFVDHRPEMLLIEGVVKNQLTELPVPMASVFVGDQEVKTNENGEWNFEMEVGKQYDLAADKESLLLVERQIAEPQRGESNFFTLWMKPVIAKVVVMDKESGEIIPGALIKLRNTSSELDVKPQLLMDAAAYYTILENSSYDISGAKKNYFTRSINTNTKELEKDTVHWKIILDKIVLNKEITLENIYYDLNKATIRSDAKLELQKLVKMMSENPTVSIELGSHTDARGSKEYNRSLSQRRAESVVKFLIENGIASERMMAVGYGENKLVNECADGVKCSKAKHQENRRTEFKVTKF